MFRSDVLNSLPRAAALEAIRVPRLVPSDFITQITHCIRMSAVALFSLALIWPLIAAEIVWAPESLGETAWRISASTAPAGELRAVATASDSSEWASNLAVSSHRRTIDPATSHETSGVGETLGAVVSKLNLVLIVPPAYT